MQVQAKVATLAIQGIVAGYGGSEVLHGVSLDVPQGNTVVLLGPNGAGKSTLLSAISGLVRHRAGRIMLDGRDVSGMPAHERARIGICHVPEGRRVFKRQSVEDNLLIGSYASARDAAWRPEAFRWVYELFPVLERKRGKPAGSLSGGEQQMLAVAQGIMGKPRILLLDEPSAGLAPVLVKQMLERVRLLRERGIAVLMVEQAVSGAMAVADYVYVLSSGQIVGQGTVEEMQGHDLAGRYLSDAL
jgi:branched-chain amino acid transport system ATP-binding protein